MAVADREAAYLALFALGQGMSWPSTLGDGGSFVTTSRRVKLFNDVGADQRPALFQAEHDETWTQKTGLPYKRQLNAHWIIYIASGKDSMSVPADELNAILTAAEVALAPKPGDPGWPSRNTLGGLVYHCWIEGEVFKDPGDLDGDGLLMIPFKILAP